MLKILVNTKLNLKAIIAFKNMLRWENAKKKKGKKLTIAFKKHASVGRNAKKKGKKLTTNEEVGKISFDLAIIVERQTAQKIVVGTGLE